MQVYQHKSAGGFGKSELEVLIVSLGLPSPSLHLPSPLFLVFVFFHFALRKDSDYPCADVLHNGISAANRAVN